MGRRRAGERAGRGRMGRAAAMGLGLLLSLFLLPLFLLRGEAEAEERTDPPQATLPLGRKVVEAPGGETEESWDERTRVRVLLPDGAVQTLSMADYLWRVVAAEMPASFEEEALKAQAAAARTYTVRRMEAETANHPQADVCANIGCCQAYITPREAMQNWGEKGEEYAGRIRAAVTGTDGMGALYGGEPIQAVFFSSAAGRTVDAAEVWGTETPYLTGVESPEGEEVPGYHTTAEIPLEEARRAILEAAPQADLSGPPGEWFKAVAYNSAGGVESVEVGGVRMSGAALRGLFDLRSVNFTLAADERAVTFSVTGYGHGVGMSQYGANRLAQEGKSWEEILKWYYSGVTVGMLGG